jgi:HD-like signal output (HDOD) protein
MAPLFFWRRKKRGEPGPVAAQAPPAFPPPGRPTVPQKPVQRMVYAEALYNPRAADTADVDASQTQLVQAATQTVAHVGTEPRYTPRRPSLLPQLLEAVNDEEASLRALSRIVMQDPRLTGEMLRIANSALYRVSPEPVESIERAAALLGTRGIRMLMSAALLEPLTHSGGRSDRFGDVIWEHSTYSATAADAWATRSQDADPFTAQMLALLHGLGVVTVYRVLMDLYAVHTGLQQDAVAVTTAIEGSASMAACRIASSWGLSESTQQALEANPAGGAGDAQPPLARALQFGLLAGGLTLLCRHGRLTEFEAQDQLDAAGFQGPAAGRIWERLLRAYVRP